ncbi:hypothetical protein I546_3594 [Mycobacterium kansasii 732]|nr:hypothetical protein I546_3594 [Mycobacterium kansasii 732]
MFPFSVYICRTEGRPGAAMTRFACDAAMVVLLLMVVLVLQAWVG